MNTNKNNLSRNKFKNLEKIIIYKLLIKFILIIISFQFLINKKEKEIKIAICTIGKKENLYVKEYIDYYIKLGVDKIFIYDDNDLNSEKIADCIDNKYQGYIKIYQNKKDKLFYNQSEAFTNCYQNIKEIFDWVLMIDMDEYLFINKDELKTYLLKPIFNKCDFIKFHWVHPTDNNHLYYENKSLFERFKPPYKKSIFIKSIIRGNISNLKYLVHSPYISPFRNISCNNVGKIIKNDDINYEYIDKINIDKAFIIHFNYKSTEEFIKKYKRGYSDWFGERIKGFLGLKIDNYFSDNEITNEKINYMEKELKINLSKYKNILKKK